MKTLALLLLCASIGRGRPFAPAIKQRHVPITTPLFYKDGRETTTDALLPAQVDRSCPEKVPVLERAQNYLMASSLIYFFADLRMLSYCGYAATPFKDVDAFHGSDSMTAFKFLTIILQELEALIERRIDSGVEKQDWLSNARLLQILDTILEFDPNLLKGIEKGSARANDLEELVEYVNKIKVNNTMSRLSADLNEQAGMVSCEPQRVYEARDIIQEGLTKMTADAIRGMTGFAEAPFRQGKALSDMVLSDEESEKPRFRDLLGLFSKQSDDETYEETSTQLTGDQLDEDTIIGPLLKSFTTESLTETSMFTKIFTDDVELVYFNDRYQSKKCVYAITVNKTQKRVTVTFRGTVSFADWTKNVQIAQEDVVFDEDPSFEDPKSHSIGIHSGFYKFLLRERHDSENGGPLSRFDHIIDKAKDYLEDDEWRLCATGHSLGGALATLFGFYAANDPRIIKNGLPVEIFSFASPLVGDARFRRAFKSLESKGKIMHARICNAGDIVTMLPFFDAVPKKSGYQHTGLQLQLPALGSSKSADVFHYTNESWLENTKRTLVNLRHWVGSLPKILGAAETHSIHEYEQRLVAAIKKVNGDDGEDKNGLDMDLDEFYAKRIVPEIQE